MSRPYLSIVVPCYRSGDWLADLARRVKSAMATREWTYELILVNDSSPDMTWQAIQEIAGSDENVRGINLAFNTGQFRTTFCGIQEAKGEIVVTMDDDLQQPPEEIPMLVDALQADENIDAVLATFTVKKHRLFRNVGSAVMNTLFRLSYGKPKDIRSTTFRAMRSQLVKSICQYSTVNPNINPLIFQTTQKLSAVRVNHEDRKHGRSGYGIIKLFRLMTDNVLSVSTLPLKIVTSIGVLAAFGSVMLALFYLARYWVGGIEPNTGFMTQVLLINFFGGLTLLSIGLLGEYVIRIMEEVRGRPRFLVKDTTDTEAP
ncbi:MAG: glycosyltransferase family 2 protein [Planctomycetota bacterium]|nr:glycosyltransferase family 2 protein [Planctomycetota bacterium]